jgi:hypothetical protein
VRDWLKVCFLWDVTPYSLLVGYQPFEETCCLYLCQVPVTHWNPDYETRWHNIKENHNINIDHHENLECKRAGFIGIEGLD